MTQQTLMLIEATGIQEYIFGSNELLQHVGASYLTEAATTTWLAEALNELPVHHNMAAGIVREGVALTQELDCEVVYAGGGNALLLFADEGLAHNFAQRLTRRVLREAPGLQLALKRRVFDHEHDVLPMVLQELRGELVRRKLDLRPSRPLLGLGVTAACDFTGAPATGTNEGRFISAEVEAKLGAQAQGQQRLGVYLPQVGAAGYEFLYDFDVMGTRGKSSYLAVVHTDANDMGARIEDIGKHHQSASENKAFIQSLRRFSQSVQEATRIALSKTVDVLLASIDSASEKVSGTVPIPHVKGKRRLPFRPVVFGGDDVTFVCEGRLGLSLAARYLLECTDQYLEDGKPLHARAGVAVVKSHYPFSRAYRLSEELCASAKSYIEEWKTQGEFGLTVLDWHFATSGLVLPLREVRQREYRGRVGSLLMRPLRLNKRDGDWRSWATFVSVMADFQRENGYWAGRRNKVKALRDVLREGPEAVSLFMAGEELPQDKPALPKIPQWPDMQTQGWQAGQCGYYDAIEALDFYVPLQEGVRP